MKEKILSFIGFRDTIAKELGEYHYYKLFQTCIMVFFTALVSALLITLFLIQFFSQLSVIVIVGITILWFLLVLLIDRAIVTAHSKQDGYLFWIRLCIIAGFVIMHSSVLDLQFFHNDIKSHLNNKHQDNTQAIYGQYNIRLEAINNQIQQLRNNNNTLANEIIIERQKVDNEVDNGNGTNRIGGYGKIARFKDSSYVVKRRLIERKIKNNKRSIQVQDSLRLDILQKQQSSINELTTFENTGVVSRLGALHSVIFNGENNILSIIFFVAFLLIGITIESAPLIVKYTHRKSIKMYHLISEKEDIIFEKQLEHKTKKGLKEEEIRHIMELENIIQTMEYQQKFSLSKEKMNQFFSYLKSREVFLDEILKKEKEGKKKYSKNYYEHYFIPKVITPFLEKFLKEEIND